MEPHQISFDPSLLTELSQPQQLYLKPEAKLNITVALPQVRLPGKTISNWEVTERLKQMVHPEEFIGLRVSKSSLEFIRFDAEIENRTQLPNLISLLEGKSIKLSGFPEPLKVKAAESKPDFPTRHDWDKYFRDAKNMNEMKPGERPDTLHVENIPSKWFVSKKDERNGIDVPNEFTLQKVFEVFGEVRCVDIPMLDPYRNKMKTSISGIKKFSHSTDSTFDAYIQYKEYICFVKAMNALRGMKLVRWDGNKAFSASIKVDFDKTKHLSDMSIRKRKLEREKLIAKEREKEEEKRREEEAIKAAIEEENRKKVEEKEMKGLRQKEREEKRRQKILKKLKKKEAEQMNIKIAIEERKLLMAQRKLESIRLLDELFERIKQEKQLEEDREVESEEDGRSKGRKEEKHKQKHHKNKKKKFMDKEKEMRKKLVKKIKSAQEQRMVERREKLKKTIEGKNKLKNSLKGGQGAAEGESSPHLKQGDYGFDAFCDFPEYDSFRGAYGYPEWNVRGFPSSFLHRRYQRGFRGGLNHFHGEWLPFGKRMNEKKISGMRESSKKGEKVPEGAEDISSDSSSSSMPYSTLNSSSETEETQSRDGRSIGHVGGDWPDLEAHAKGDVENIGFPNPWLGYSDYYSARFVRGRSSRRPRGVYIPRRGSWSRGFPGPQINPNVPLNSFYMQSINSQYYKYFNKLAKGDYSKSKSRSRSRSRSHSSDRVVCRKVLSRSRSRSRRYSRSRSKSKSKSSSGGSRERSRSRRLSKGKAGGDRDKSDSRSSSRSRGRESKRRKSEESKEKRSKSKSRSKKSSKSGSAEKSNGNNVNKKKEETVAEDQKASEGKKDKKKEEPKSRERSKRKSKEKKGESPTKGEESEWSLSLSGSDEWSRGSPERKARPLGDPSWIPDRRDRDADRNYRSIMSKIGASSSNFPADNYLGNYNRSRIRGAYRCEEREPHLRSHVSRPIKSMEIFPSGDVTKKSRHKKEKKRKKKYHEKESDSRKIKDNRRDR